MIRAYLVAYESVSPETRDMEELRNRIDEMSHDGLLAQHILYTHDFSQRHKAISMECCDTNHAHNFIDGIMKRIIFPESMKRVRWTIELELIPENRQD